MTDDARITALILRTDIEPTPYPSKINPDVALYQRIVGGYLEGVHCTLDDGTRVTMYVNEEGVIHGLPVNPVATLLARRLAPYLGGQTIVGNVILVGVRDCDDADVPPAAVTLAQQLHHDLRIEGYVRALVEKRRRT